MPAAVKVVVTQELVDRAVQRDSHHCMIAEAIKEQNPHFARILVDLQTIRWTNTRTGKRYICLTPEEAAAKLVDFDQGRQIEPFAFAVKVVQVTGATPGNRGRKQLDGQMTIHGGNPLPHGHLRGEEGSGSDGAAKIRAHRARAAAARSTSNEVAEPPDQASNIVRSSRAYRQYGRRLLKG